MRLTDLQVVVQIIDLATEKGVFKGADLKPVGEVRERIIEFIKTNAKPVDGTTEGKQEGATDESATNVTK